MSIFSSLFGSSENEKPTTFSELENQTFERLYQFENVVLSPHIAGWTHESKERLAKVLLKRIENVLKSE